ncbi:MAG TPA: hypothetical protein PKH24_07970 [Sedimentisphaerales bacterium]|jgi:hypothetical protein|nr:hypothetical protein [Sedimentisphaerales bacterium]HNU29298.1 hypothetical protein [Sedimentisphaerales bacterium]
MSNTQVMQQMQAMLGPARARLGRLRLARGLREALVLGSLVTPATLGVTLLLGLLVRPMGALTRWQLAMIVGAALSSAAACLILKCGRLLLHRPSWQDAAEVLDGAGNPHDLIVTAYDLAGQNRNSIFARMAVERGVTALKAGRNRPFGLAAPSPAGSRIGMGLLATLLLAAVVVLLPRAGGEVVTVVGTASADSPASTDASTALVQAQREQAEPPSVSRPAIQALSASRQTKAQEALLAVLPTSLARTGASQNEAGPTRQAFSAQSPSANAASPQETPPSDSRPSATPRATAHPASPPSAEEESSTNPTHTRQRAGGSGAPDSESRLKASLLSGETDPDSDEENQDDLRQEKQQQRALAGTGGQPLLSDRLGAPSRELGLSGKKSDLPPEGRGGPSDLKRSRATATILSGLPVPVHVKGMKQQGKSKSQARAMPLGASDTESRSVVEAAGPGHEGHVRRYAPDEAWQAVLGRYYQNLRESESNQQSE